MSAIKRCPYRVPATYKFYYESLAFISSIPKDSVCYRDVSTIKSVCYKEITLLLSVTDLELIVGGTWHLFFFLIGS